MSSWYVNEYRIIKENLKLRKHSGHISQSIRLGKDAGDDNTANFVEQRDDCSGVEVFEQQR